MLPLLMIMTMIKITAGDRCNKEVKQGPYHLKGFEPEKINIAKNKMLFYKVHTGGTMETTMKVGYRSYWISYCYQGGPLDGNTGCENGVISDRPSEEELEEWSKLELCKTGLDYSNQWSSDAGVCLNDKRNNLNSFKMKELNKISNNNHFAFHTCNKSWRCGIQNSKLPIRVKCEEGIDVREDTDISKFCWVYYLMPNGTEVKMVAGKKEVIGQGSYTYIIEPTGNLLKETVELECFINPEGGNFCHEPQTDTYFKNVKKEFYCTRGTCYQPVNTLMKSHFKNSRRLIKHPSPQLTATIEDLQLIVEELNFDNLGLRYNLALLDKRFTKLTYLFNTLVKSVSKIDDKLIGNMLGREAESTFITEEYFYMSPCMSVPSSDTNCLNGSIYKEGRWIPNSKPEECVKTDHTLSLDFYEFSEFFIPYIESYNFYSSPNDYGGWSFVANSKESLLSTMQYTKNGGGGTSMEDVVSLPSGYLLNHLSGLSFGMGGISLFTVLGLLVLFLVLKKLL